MCVSFVFQRRVGRFNLNGGRITYRQFRNYDVSTDSDWRKRLCRPLVNLVKYIYD